MSEKPGFFRRLFRFIGTLITGIRHLISLVLLVFFAAVIFGMLAEDIQPIPDKGALFLAPSGILVDQKTYIDPFSQVLAGGDEERETLVRDLVEAIDLAGDDSRITHLVINTNHLLGGGLAKLDEVGRALLRFKQSGKPVIAFGDNFTQQQYYLAAHADEIYLNPMGGVLITGFGAYQNYFADALAKLKINIHVFRAGRYKDAVEPFTRNDMSEASRQQLGELIGDLWQQFSTGIEAQRDLPAGTLDAMSKNLHLQLAAQGGDAGKLAVESGLVDKLMSRTELDSYLNARLPKNSEGYAAVGMRAYLNHHRLMPGEESAAPEDKIALVVAKGTILDGEQPDGSIGGDTLADMFDDINHDNQVKAVVLRIDSPGGSAFASEIIRDAIAATRAKGIPVIVSMGSYAASGGYWIAANSDRVFAMPGTLTGSIGVFGVIPTFEDSFAALGIHSDGVASSDFSSLFQLDRAMSPAAESLIQQGVDHTYQRFLQLVAEGRDKTTAEVDKIAQGRVWSGIRAKELGLVDELGDLQDAVAAAAELAGLNSYQLDLRQRPLSLMEQVLKELSSNTNAALQRSGLNSLLPSALSQQLHRAIKPLTFAGQLNDPRNTYLYCFDCPL